jgi:hypothetical protein
MPKVEDPSPAEAQAIAKAERFVAENGYADAPANRATMVRALQERGLPREAVEQMRHNTLRPRAYGVSPQQGPNAPGWTVAAPPAGGREAT